MLFCNKQKIHSFLLIQFRSSYSVQICCYSHSFRRHCTDSCRCNQPLIVRCFAHLDDCRRSRYCHSDLGEYTEWANERRTDGRTAGRTDEWIKERLDVVAAGSSRQQRRQLLPLNKTQPPQRRKAGPAIGAPTSGARVLPWLRCADETSATWWSFSHQTLAAPLAGGKLAGWLTVDGKHCK